MPLSVIQPEHLPVQPLPSNILSAQPGGGTIMSMGLAWGCLRRRLLRRFRPAYVERMRRCRQGHCPGCTHDVIDHRDLKFIGNVCGVRFATRNDRKCTWVRLPIATWGLGEVIVIACPLLLLAGLLAWWSLTAALPIALAGAFVMWFFRDPPRQIPKGPGILVAPADGVITDLVELAECPYFNGPAIRIGIYLSLFNVHLNRVPETAQVIEVRYSPGQFLNSRNRSAGSVNEQLWTLFQTAGEDPLLFVVKQVAGAFASRIVCAARPGETLERGTKFGMIKFGSRTELFVAYRPDLRVMVSPWSKVRGGTTVLIKYRERRRDS
jgi:phosphatidylserine decarboxylase